MIVIDTSALVRFFTQDDLQKAAQIKKLFDSDQTIMIPDVVFPELEYVVTGKVYKASRKNFTKALNYLTTRKNIIISQDIKKAVEIYANSNLDIADCIIAASSIGCKLFSYDQRLLAVGGVKQAALD